MSEEQPVFFNEYGVVNPRHPVAEALMAIAVQVADTLKQRLDHHPLPDVTRACFYFENQLHLAWYETYAMSSESIRIHFMPLPGFPSSWAIDAGHLAQQAVERAIDVIHEGLGLAHEDAAMNDFMGDIHFELAFYRIKRQTAQRKANRNKEKQQPMR